MQKRRFGLGALGGLIAAVLALMPGATRVAAAPAGFHPVTPFRVMDTRSGVGGPRLAGGESRELVVAPSASVPPTASAVVLNVTVTEPEATGYLTVWPSGSAQPETSSLNFAVGQTVPNLVTVGVGAQGRISLFNFGGPAHVLVDVTGWFDGGFTGVRPVRLMDTRRSFGAPTFGAGANASLQVAGVAGIPSDAVGVALNVTATNATAVGFLTVWPAGRAQPGSSNLNLLPGETRPNMVLVGVGEAGRVDIANFAGTTDVLVDVTGWFSVGGGFTAVTPARVLDTRSGSCGLALGPGEIRTLTVVGAGGVPATGVGGIAANVTVTNASLGGYLTVWPAGQPQPDTSNLNFVPGQTVPNMVTVGVGAAGQISVFNASGTVDVLIDVMGSFNGDTPGGTTVACPSPSVTFGFGTKRVGSEVPAGRYVAPGSPTGNCYWERLRGFGGTLDEIVANDNVTGPVVVDIKADDVGFRSTAGCGTWRSFAPTGPPASTFGAGVFVIGSPVLPGRYLATPSSTCYWERLRSFGGSFSEIIANDNDTFHVVVDIASSDVGFASSRCGTWRPYAAPPAPATTFGDGTWVVGSDIVAGQYQTTATSSCSWQRLRGFGGASADIIGNGSGTGSVIVAIAPGDAGFGSSGCGTWTRVGA